jgi:Dehydrogenases (flavoproteins)
VIHEAGVADLENYARGSDLVILAGGKGDIVKLFERDAERSPFDKPQRALALTYVTGLTPYAPTRVAFNIAPTVGEYFVFPSLTTTGPCEIMVLEGIPGGPMDCWDDVKTPEQHLERSLDILKKFYPWEYERSRNAKLTDPNGILAGRFPPTVRKPVARLPSGALILGMADAVVLNDPITGQGSNNAAKAARIYLKRILENGNKPFDGAWMQQTFDDYWAYAQFVTGWTNAMLQPPPPHVINILVAAQSKPKVGKRSSTASTIRARSSPGLPIRAKRRSSSPRRRLSFRESLRLVRHPEAAAQRVVREECFRAKSSPESLTADFCMSAAFRFRAAQSASLRQMTNLCPAI